MQPKHKAFIEACSSALYMHNALSAILRHDIRNAQVNCDDASAVHLVNCFLRMQITITILHERMNNEARVATLLALLAYALTRFFSSVKVVVSVTSARTWSKMGSRTLSKMRIQKGVVKAAPWKFSVSNNTCNVVKVALNIEAVNGFVACCISKQHSMDAPFVQGWAWICNPVRC